MKCSKPTEEEMRGLNRVEKKLLTVNHAILAGMFEEALNHLADNIKIDRKLVWRLLFAELRINGKTR